VHAKSHFTTVLSHATLSAARFQQQFVAIVGGIPSVTVPDSLTAASAHLQSLEDDWVAQFVGGGPRLLENHEARKLFDNFDTADGKLMDGNAYGIIIHGKGVLVNQFAEAQSADFGEDAQDVTIRNTKIHNVLARVNEIVTVNMPVGSAGAGKPMVDVVGSVMRVDEQKTDPFGGTGTFILDALHELRFEYDAFVSGLDPGT